MLAGALLEGVSLVLLVPIAGLLLHGAEQGSGLSYLLDLIPFQSQLGQMAVLLALFVSVVALRAGVLTLRDRRLAILQLGFVEQQRSLLIMELAAAPWSYVASLRHARVTAAVGTEVHMIAATAQLMLQCVVTTSMLIAQWLLVLVIAPWLALLVAALGIIGTIGIIPTLRRASHTGFQQVERQMAVMNAAGQILAGLKLAKAQNAEAAFLEDFHRHSQALNRNQIDNQRRQSRLRVANASVTAIVGAIMVLGGMLLGLPLAHLVTAIMILARMSGPVMTLQQNAYHIATMLPAHASMSTLRSGLRQSRDDNEPASDLSTPIDSIASEDAGFLYSDGGGVDGVSVTFRRGEVVGITGPSGSGKTTFIDLLTGLLQPETGQVLVNGRPCNAQQFRRYRDRIAYVPQDSYLLNDTIRHNLAWGRFDVSEAAMWRALETAGAGQFVRRMQNGLDTPVAERGSRLSGGERQRIAIARALLRDPDVMILDEATNAIDLGSEQSIIAELTAMQARPAIILVTHRTETLRACGRVLTFKAGQVSTDGQFNGGPGQPEAPSGG